MDTMRSIQVSKHDVTCLLPSPNGSIVVAWCNDGFLRFYRSQCATEVGNISYRGEIISMCWARAFRGRQALACLCSDGNVRLWRLEDYSPDPDPYDTVINTGYTNDIPIPVQGGVVTSDIEGTQLAIGCPGMLTVWSLKSKAPACRAGLHTAHSHQLISHVQFLSEERILVFFKRPGQMVEHDLKTNTIVSNFRVCGNISSATLSGTDSVVINTGDEGLQVYGLHSPPPSAPNSWAATGVDFIHTLEQSVAKNLTTSPILLSAAMVIWGTDSGEVAIWNTRTGRLEASFQVQPGTSITCIGLLSLSAEDIVLTDGNLTIRIVTGSKVGLQISSLRLTVFEGGDFGFAEQGSKPSIYNELETFGVTPPQIGHTDYLFFLWARILNLLILSVLLTAFVREYEFIIIP